MTWCVNDRARILTWELCSTMLLTMAKIQVLSSLEFSLYIWRKRPYMMWTFTARVPMCWTFSVCLRASTLLHAPQDLLWITSMALLPFGPKGSISRGLEGGRGERSAPSCLVTAHCSSSCQMALSTQHCLSLGSGDHPLLSLEVVTPAVPALALIPCGFSTPGPHLCK